MQDDLQDDSLYLPPCYADAAKPEDVYRFEDSILGDEQVSGMFLEGRGTCTETNRKVCVLVGGLSQDEQAPWLFHGP